MKKLKDIIRNLGLKDNEVIITVEELDNYKSRVKTTSDKAETTTPIEPVQTTEPVEKQKTKRKLSKTIWIDQNRKGKINKRANGKLVYYYYDKINKRPYSKEGTYDELIKFAEYFEQTGYDTSKFTKQKETPTYIYERNGVYQIRKSIKGKTMDWGSYSDEKLAIEVREFLIYKKWDLKYHPHSLTPAYIKRLGIDEYYLTLKPIMYADKDYQSYKLVNGILN